MLLNQQDAVGLVDGHTLVIVKLHLQDGVTNENKEYSQRQH